MSTPASDAVRLPEQFGRYRILRPLGQGGMGAVYLARDTRLDRDVALKVCTLADSPNAMERFRREAKAAAALSHPNLCPLYDFDVHDGIAFITMKFVDGASLGHWLAAHPLDFRGVGKLVYKLALAMQAAHDGGVIHRDLKPGNIAIDNKGEPVILDFGLARLIDARTHKTQQGAIFGTLTHMAPEQARGDTDAIGPATDVYALGVILYEMMTGELPFIGPPEMILAQVLAAQPKPPRQFKPDIPESLETICLQALAKKPEDRFSSMKAFADALAQAMSGLSTTAAISRQVSPLPPELTQLTEAERSQQHMVPPPLPTTDATTLGPAPRRFWLAIGVLLALLTVLTVAVWSGVQAYRNKPVAQVDPKKDSEPPSERDKDKDAKKPDPIPIVEPPQPLNCLRFAADAVTIQSVQQAWAKHLKTEVERSVDLGNGVKMKLTLIPPGKFRMGATQDEIDQILKQYKHERAAHFQNELPQHDVEITRGYWLGTYTVTQEEFGQMMGRNPSYFEKQNVKDVITTRRFPVEQVSWYDAVEFCNKLSVKLGKKPCYRLSNEVREDGTIINAEFAVLQDGTGFRLPTEAEWEYACRAGTTTPFHFGSTLNGSEANCNGMVPHGTEKKGPYLKRPRAVGEAYQPNAFGLHNMHGNVWQWCEDWYDESYYEKGDKRDPKCTKFGKENVRALRGGSWRHESRYCRANSRYGLAPSSRYEVVGCRLVLNLD